MTDLIITFQADIVVLETSFFELYVYVKGLVALVVLIVVMSQCVWRLRGEGGRGGTRGSMRRSVAWSICCHPPHASCRSGA